MYDYTNESNRTNYFGVFGRKRRMRSKCPVPSAVYISYHGGIHDAPKIHVGHIKHSAFDYVS